MQCIFVASGFKEVIRNHNGCPGPGTGKHLFITHKGNTGKDPLDPMERLYICMRRRQCKQWKMSIYLPLISTAVLQAYILR